ncbi:MAG: folate family ECF transporter S component [Firmicutes bacterium]|nr:folate family ECF transporter S component [Bacillota bacterium]MBR6799266.1 folate family ECF transporter S component [Bacillota bacterium]
MNKRSATTRLVIMAFLIALEIILTRFCSINTPILRIGFGFLPVAMMGIMYGPIWAAVGYAVGDILGMLIFPSGIFFPGFTATAMLTGLVFGLFLHNKEKITWKTVLPASLIIILVLNLCLDTLWLSIMFGDAFIALLPTRIFKCVVMLPIHLVLIPLVWNRVMSKIPGIAK